jgi:hypothetical protein
MTVSLCTSLYITNYACDSYAFAMRWQRLSGARARARAELRALLITAAKRDADAQGRELWRCSKRLGRGLRLVIEWPQPGHARLLWAGHGVPPVHLWATP